MPRQDDFIKRIDILENDKERVGLARQNFRIPPMMLIQGELRRVEAVKIPMHSAFGRG